MLAFGDTSNQLQFYDLGEARVIAPIPMTSRANVLAFSPKTSQLACGTYAGTVMTWEIVTENTGVRLIEQFHFPPSMRCVRRLLFNADGTTLARNGETKGVYVADISHEHTLYERAWNKNAWYEVSGNHLDQCFAFSGDGQKLVTESKNLDVLVLDAATGTAVNTLSGHTSNLTAFAASPAPNVLASSDAGGVIKLWDVESGMDLATTRLSSPDNGMNISGATGLTVGQRGTLAALGAIVD